MNKNRKKVVIVGAGVVGLTSAYLLVKAGFDVHVVEQNKAPGGGASKANAGQLLYDRIGAMGSPGFLKNLPKTLLGGGEGVIATGLAKPENWPWAYSFLGQCSNRAWRDNTKQLLKIAHRSRDVMESFKVRNDFDFSWRKPGKLVLHDTEAALQAAERVANYQGEFGGRHKIVSRQECLEREPALKETSRFIAGGILIPDAEVADCNLFCHRLASLLVENFGVKITYETSIEKLEQKGGKVVGLRTPKDTITSDVFVIATGVEASKLLPVSFPGRKPIVGVKGISLTFPAGKIQPTMSVADTSKKIVMLSLKNHVRVTGFGIFSDNLEINREHVNQLAEKARQLMPQACLYEQEPQVWTGLRPQTPDDLPMIGEAGFKNVYVNAGHGSLGWTLAFGSADILSEIVAADQR